jgi:hypothetical protein
MRVALQLFLLITALSLASVCQADTSGGKDQPTDLEQLRQIVEKQGKQLKEQQQQIEKLLMRLGAGNTLNNVRGQGEPGQDQAPAAENTDKEKKPAGKQPSQAQEELPTQPVGRPPEKPPLSKQYKEIEAIFQQQGVLTPKHTLVVEPSFQYAYSSSNEVLLSGYTIVPALTVGLINTERVERNTYIPALTLRYGLTDRLEMQVYVPWIHREDSTVLTAQNIGTTNEVQPIFNTKGSDIGDVQFGLRYQFNSALGGGPIFIGGLLAKSRTGSDPFNVPTDPTTGTQLRLPTGTGFWGVQPSMSVIFPSDPVVFFGSTSFLYNFRADYPISGVETEIVPGATFAFNFGIGFSLNERTSLSMGYEHFIIFPTDVVSSSVVLSPIETQSTTVGCLVFGAAYRWNERFNINFSLEAGITKDAPDVQLTVRFPFSI